MRREDDLNREIQSHLDLEAEEQRQDGAAPDQARYAARRAFGNTALVKEAVRGTWGWTALDRLWRDLRYAVCVLRKAPGFTAAAVLSLALGIGANTAIFSLLNAVVLRLLPVPDPQQLVQLTYTFPGARPDWNSFFDYPQLRRFRTRATTLSGIFGGTSLGRVNLGSHGTAGLAHADAYTDNFFSVLGVTPQYGRLFGVGDDRLDASVVVLSDGYWRTRFAADPSIVGQQVTLNQLSFIVIGITPPGFSGIHVGGGPDLWVPLHALERFKPDPKRWEESFASWLLIAGRLRPSVSFAQAQAELDVLHHQLLVEQLSVSEQRDRQSIQRFVRESRLVLHRADNGVDSGLRDAYAFPLKLLMGVAGVVLLIACANVANLLLARVSSRRREIAVRLALGAGRTRVVRQFLMESLLLAAMGGALALAFAWWGSAALVRMIFEGESPVPLDVAPDWRVFVFAAGVSPATGVLFGVVPALKGTRFDPGRAMREGALHFTRSSRTLDRVLVAVQVALSVVLVTGAGLFARTLQNYWNVEVGYQRDNVLMFSVDAKLAGYPKRRHAPLYREILDKAGALPGIQAASVSIVRPVDDQYYLVDRVDSVDDRTLPDREAIHVAWNGIGPGFFATLGTPLLLGREFDARDDQATRKVVIVNESFARQALPGVNPIGHRVSGAQIVGVVKDSRYAGLRQPSRAVMYWPLFQLGPGRDPADWVGVGSVSFEVRYRAGASVVDDVRRMVRSIDRNLPVFRVNTLRAQTEDSLLRERLLATLSTFFGALALLLACLGLYGLMACAVARRTGEIGIRMALGAGRERILWLVLRETLALALAGIAAGIPLALWMARYSKTLLFGVAATDPATLVFSAALLVGIAIAAGWLPARRAARIEPMAALKYE